MFCPNCGFKQLEGAKFCNNCGLSIKIYCPNCGKIQNDESNFCNNCGIKIQQKQNITPAKIDKNTSDSGKNKYVATAFAFFLGTLGIHKFYLGQYFQGIFYLLFSWTGIPTVIGFIEAAIYLGMSDEKFQKKYND